MERIHIWHRKKPVIASACFKARGNPEIFLYSLNWIASSLTLLAMTAFARDARALVC